MSKQFSDELLNAYLDGELDHQERERIIEAVANDKSLSERTCRLQKVREMVQLAYHMEQDTFHAPQQKEKKRSWPKVAALFLIALGPLSGWFAHMNLSSQPTLTQLAKTARIDSVVSQDKNAWQLVLHVNTNDPYRINTLLDETEQLLKTSAAKNDPVKVEILTNGKGLSLLEAKDTLQSQRLRKIVSQYDNITLLACQRAIDRLKHEKGVKLELIPQAKVVESAMHRAIVRQKEGWAYLRI